MKATTGTETRFETKVVEVTKERVTLDLSPREAAQLHNIARDLLKQTGAEEPPRFTSSAILQHGLMGGQYGVRGTLDALTQAIAESGVNTQADVVAARDR